MIVLPDNLVVSENFTLPTTICLLNSNESLTDEYAMLANAPSTLRPAPCASLACVAPSATVTHRSVMFNVDALTVVCVPATRRLPNTTALYSTVKLPVVTLPAVTAPAR